MNKSIALAASFLITASPLFAADNLLQDPNFSTVGQSKSVWQVGTDKGGKITATVAVDGKTPALHLAAAQITQAMQNPSLPEGDYELTVQAKGSGELLLSATGERPQMLGKDWGTYGYLFHSTGIAMTVTIGVALDGTISSPAILPATDAQKAALRAEANERARVGFITVSAQRPTPGVASQQFEGKVKPLAAMNQLVVLDEPRFSTCNAANVDRLVNWLGNNGFKKLDGDQLPVWMNERIRKGDAYGSVVVLPRGITPIKLIEGPQDNKPLWLEYLRAGGRIVHMGDIPFNYEEATGAEPSNVVNIYGRCLVLLGLDYGSVIYCGGFPVTATEAHKTWGLENADAASNGVPLENTTVAFHVYTVPSINKQGASDYFRNLRPDMPWSGLVKFLQGFDANNDSQMRDVWRAAHYVGKPVTIPPLPPPLPPPLVSKIQMKADGVDQRHEFVRGEEVSVNVAVDPTHQAGTVRLDLLEGGKNLYSETQPGSSAAFVLKTAPYADGSYDLQATVLQNGKTMETESEKIGIRYLAPGGFNFEIGYSPVPNPRRNDMVFAGLHALGMEFYTTPLTGINLDSVVRNHVGFAFRGLVDFGAAKGKPYTYEEHPEYYKMNSQGKPVVTGPYSGGRPMPGFTHPDIMENIRVKMEEQVRAVAQLPSLRPYILCNDDFAAWYGFDYAPHVLDAFKADTGLDAPRKMEWPTNYGAIPDTQPWVQWSKWTLINVNGKLNKVETEAATKVRPDIRIGPIPGGMSMPLVQIDDVAGAAQYPPYSFGKDGFNLIASYYYNGYWQPSMTTTYWMEIGRMGNRDLPEWNMPDVLYSKGYTLNQFYHYMAGGVQGLVYFLYEQRTKGAWDAIERVAPVIRRVGPVQMELKPAQRDIGMLNSFTSICFSSYLSCVQCYAYDNLVQGHFSVEMVSEEDILEGRASAYKTILLYDVQYLSQSVFDALAKYAAGGGLVLIDKSVPFDIPGAKHIDIDTGMGAGKTLPVPYQAVHLSTPGIKEYGDPDRIALIKKAFSEYVKPRFESSDIKLGAFNFESGTVPYTWFVNVQDGKEYQFSHLGAMDRSPKHFQEVVDWENSEMAKGPYTSTLEYTTLPGVPYDLVSGKKLPVTKTKSGRFAVTVSMDRFGGTLVAWLPAELTEVTLSAPKSASANQAVQVTATVMAKDKPMPGAISVEFILRDPKGKESIVSGVRATKEGAAAFDWTPAVNDPVGNWTLEARELASGKTAKAKITLAN